MESSAALKKIPRNLGLLASALLALAVSLPAVSANYPLELVSPRAVGTSPASGNASITSSNRIFRAYPGIEYNIRAVIVGGAYPYTVSLSNAPAGMTIDAGTGLIRWPNPSGTSATPTISVTDAEGTTRTSPWTIAVTTEGFYFVDAANGSNYPTGTGTISNPFRRISDLRAAPGANVGQIAYFRSGVYTALDMPRESVGTTWERVELGSTVPNIWIGYPGDSPIIDFGFVSGQEPGVLIRPEGENVYIDNFETRNSRVIGFQVHSGQFGVFRRLRMHDHNMIRDSLDGSNASFILTMSAYTDSDVGGSPSSWGQYLAVQNCEFWNAPMNVAIKTYSQWKMVIEDNVFRQTFFGTELKADMPQFQYRRNTHIGIPGTAIGGNMHSASTHGEILFNLVNAPSGDYALDVNQDSQTKRVDIYRNTFMGTVRVRNADSQDGPFRVYNNVIINGSTGTQRVTTENTTDASRIVITDNLAGAPNGGLVDSAGMLIGSFLTDFLGRRGHLIGNEVRPRPPTGVSAQ
jgi:hypothetical protein